MCPSTRPVLPRISSSESGFFFCGMRLLPVVTSSASSKKPNSSEEYRIKSSERRLRWRNETLAANRNSSAKSRSLAASMLLREIFETLEVAAKHLKIRQGVMRPKHRLAAAQVGVAGQNHRRVVLCRPEQRHLQLAQRRLGQPDVL